MRISDWSSDVCSSDLQVQAWVLNRYCYQSHIPLKDATILSRMEDLALRREWRKRIEDHDGSAKGEGSNEGGIERWLVLAEGVGLERASVEIGRASCRERVCPSV